MGLQRIEIETPKGPVSAEWSELPAARAVVAIAHGAGGNMHNGLLDGFSAALNSAAYTTLRFNFPYSEQGRKSPDRPEVMMATWQAVVDEAHRRAPELQVYAAGKSMGGRIASMAAAEVSSSTVSIRFLVSGPVSSIVWRPTRPHRGCSVVSSLSVARLRITPRGPIICFECRIARIEPVLRILFRIQVIQVAEEFVEAMDGGQIFVAIAEMVLAELPGCVAERLQSLGNGDIAILQPDLRAGNADFRQTGAQG